MCNWTEKKSFAVPDEAVNITVQPQKGRLNGSECFNYFKNVTATKVLVVLRAKRFRANMFEKPSAIFCGIG